MAELFVHYFLSDEGKRAALAAGRNAGREQTIVLRSPGHEVPEAPADALARILNLTPNVKDAAEEQPSDPSLVDVAKALTEAVATLAKVLDPATTRNVTVEDADEALWALATELAVTTEAGVSSVRYNYDDKYGTAIVGYYVEFDARHQRFQVLAKTASTPSDRLLTAAEMLPLEKARRAALEEARLAANAEAVKKAAERNKQAEEDSLARGLSEATRFLEQVPSEYRGLPEVERLQQIVAASDRVALQVRTKDHDWDSTPTRLAQAAVRKAEADAVQAGKVAWVEAHGSERLKRLTAEGMFDDGMYRDERLALEMPGWKYGSVYSFAPTNPPKAEDFKLLDAARTIVPDAKLVLVYTDYRACKYAFKPVSSFLGSTVYYDGALATSPA